MWMWIRCRFFRIASLTALAGLAGLSGSLVHAQGSYTALDMPYHGRTLSMSGGGTADIRGTDLSMMNPALLMGSSSMTGDDPVLLFSIIRHPVDIQSEMAEWRMPWGQRMVAVSVRHLGYGDFDRRDEGAVKTGEFTAGDTWVTVSAAQRVWERVDVGLTGGIFLSQIDDVTASLGLVTLGSSLSIPEFDLVLGLSMRNLGITFSSYTEHREAIPTSVGLGLTKALAHLPLEISVDGLWWERENRGRWRIGGEFSLPNNLLLRWGLSSYRFDQQTGVVWRDITTGSSLGVGYRKGPWSIDAGFQYTGIGGSTVGIGVSMIMGRK